MEVKQDLQERMMRWRQIESLCGFPITTNPGYNYLETLLRSGLNSSRYVVLNSSKFRPIFPISFFILSTLIVSLLSLLLIATRPQGMQQLDDDGDDTCSVVSSSAGKNQTSAGHFFLSDSFSPWPFVSFLRFLICLIFASAFGAGFVLFRFFESGGVSFGEFHQILTGKSILGRFLGQQLSSIWCRHRL